MERTLVTGGAGFLGSHLCEYLLNKGHEVIAMDNLITGSVDNIAHIRNDRFHFIKHRQYPSFRLTSQSSGLYGAAYSNLKGGFSGDT